MGREILKSGSKISLVNTGSGGIINLEIISDPLGEGGSCIVYEARSENDGLACKYRLKELYPENMEGIFRDGNNQLIIPESCRGEYIKACKRFEKSLELLWSFAYSDGTGCYTVCPLGRFEGCVQNGVPAKYLITQWMPSDSVSTANLCGGNDLRAAVNICLKTAAAIKEFHKSGYINFDIKPENILYSPKTDTIAFFDTDTVFKKDDAKNTVISFSDGAAPEIVNGFEELYSEKSDVFSIGSMLHRFITGENYFSGQYSLDISAVRDGLEKYDMCKDAAPEVLSLIRRIFESCNCGNPAKRCDTESLVDMLKQLGVLLDSQKYVINSELAFSSSEVNEFYFKEIKKQKADTVLNYLYSALFFVFMTALAVLIVMTEKIKSYVIAPCIICIIVMLILKAMIFNRSEKKAVSEVCTDNCFRRYKSVLGFVNELNNSQLFEISSPGFISGVENKRHRFRIIVGASAIAAGIVSAFVSFRLNSFPFLVALYAVIMLLILAADYTYSTAVINDMYNSKCGTRSDKRNIKEIYSFKNNDIDCTELSIGCIRHIIYNEYKSRCNVWGCADVITKMLAGVIIFFFVLCAFPIYASEYFHIYEGLADNTVLYVCGFIYCAVSAVTVFESRKFYIGAKDILFSVYTDDDKYVREKFFEYVQKSEISDTSFARGIYNHALVQIEKDIPIRNLCRSEQPDFMQYCTSQKARAKNYFLLATIAVICIIVWHFGIYHAFFPITAASAVFQLWYYKYGAYAFNRMRFKLKNETDK